MGLPEEGPDTIEFKAEPTSKVAIISPVCRGPIQQELEDDDTRKVILEHEFPEATPSVYSKRYPLPPPRMLPDVKVFDLFLKDGNHCDLNCHSFGAGKPQQLEWTCLPSVAEAAQKIGGMATSGWRIVFIHGHGILWNEEPLLQIDDGHNCNLPQCPRDGLVPLKDIITLFHQLDGHTVLVSYVCLGVPTEGEKKRTMKPLETSKVALVYPVWPGDRFVELHQGDPTREFILKALAAFSDPREAITCIESFSIDLLLTTKGHAFMPLRTPSGGLTHYSLRSQE